MRRVLAILLAALALPAAGCGFGSGEEQAGDGSLTVTRDYGHESIGRARTAGVSESDTVMRLLQRDFEVETRYGGNFVQEIDGVGGGRDGGRRVDWFFYVNGIEASVGAGELEVAPGDRIWWDHHDWGATMRVPAVVGSFPAPFLSDVEGRRLPVRLVCLDGAGEACDEVETRLQDAGIEDIARSVLEQSAGREVLRVLVGPWAQMRRDTAARKLESGPGGLRRVRPSRSRRGAHRPARRPRPCGAHRRPGRRPAGGDQDRGAAARPGWSPASTQPASRPRRRR